jgi:CheY-like chemotaxis protein
VLIVDDDAMNRKVAAFLVRRQGYVADVADSGEAAIAAVARCTYGAVLMDFHMPGLNGIETTRRIRRAELGGKRVVIIATTADTTEGVREACLQAGMDDYIAKPLAPETIDAVLRKWCSVHVTPAAPSAREERAIARDVLEKMARLGGPAMLVELARHFAADTSTRADALASAIARGDADKARETARALRASADQVGAVAVTKLCARIEELAASRAVEGAKDLAERLPAEIERARAELAAEA